MSTNSYKHQPVRKVVAIFAVPRSGTSWLGQIFNSSPRVAYRYQPLFSYEFKSRLNPESSSDDIEKFHTDLLDAKSDFVLQSANISGHAGPVFKKDHIDTLVWKEVRHHNIIENLLKQDSNIKIVGMVRNPKSVINSWYHAPKEFKKDEWDIFEEWKDAPRKNQGKPEEFNGYNKWKEVAKLYLKLQVEYPNRFYLLEYSELLNNTKKEVQKLFDFCGLDYTDQTDSFILESQNTDLSDDAYSVFRKNQTDQKWKTGLPQEIISEIDKDLSGSDLEQFNE